MFSSIDKLSINTSSLDLVAPPQDVLIKKPAAHIHALHISSTHTRHTGELMAYIDIPKLSELHLEDGAGYNEQDCTPVQACLDGAVNIKELSLSIPHRMFIFS